MSASKEVALPSNVGECESPEKSFLSSSLDGEDLTSDEESLPFRVRGKVQIQTPEREPNENAAPTTNEYVLNIAFFSFIAFVVFETLLALVSHSMSMLADAQAMAVDAFTYLLNLHAERLKHRPFSHEELQLPADVRRYRRKLRRLYLELVPPCFSVITLIIVTITVLRDSMQELTREQSELDDPDVSLSIMMIVSALNLLLDVVNVGFFTQAKQAFGLQTVKKECEEKPVVLDTEEEEFTEMTNLLVSERSVQVQDSRESFNLNMCSAWTHVAADTMRSVAVLVAAAIAFVVKGVGSADADAVAAIVVSVIILLSMGPLLQGLFMTARRIYLLSTDPFRPQMP